MTTSDRFTGRAEDYQAARPKYVQEAVDFLLSPACLGRPTRLADVGSGTGILSAQLLENLGEDAVLFGVEPNASMRETADKLFADEGRFVSVEGTGESTTLAGSSVDAITVAQAFHWLDVVRARAEFQRILVNQGPVAILWNIRDEECDAFHRDYESFLRRWGSGYLAVRETWQVRNDLESFFTADYTERRFGYSQVLGAADLRRRLLSSSYAPQPEGQEFDEAMGVLDTLFEQYASDGAVKMKYHCECYSGRIH